MIRMERKGLGFGSLLRQRSMLVHEATHIWSHLHTFHGCSNHPDSLCFQAWNYGQKKPSSLCPCPVECRAQILFVDHPRWLKTRGFSWGKLIMDLDWWEHLIVLIYLDVVLKGESVLDSLSRLPSAGLHQNLRFTSCLKKMPDTSPFQHCPTAPCIETKSC